MVLPAWSTGINWCFRRPQCKRHWQKSLAGDAIAATVIQDNILMADFVARAGSTALTILALFEETRLHGPGLSKWEATRSPDSLRVAFLLVWCLYY